MAHTEERPRECNETSHRSDECGKTEHDSDCDDWGGSKLRAKLEKSDYSQACVPLHSQYHDDNKARFTIFPLTGCPPRHGRALSDSPIDILVHVVESDDVDEVRVALIGEIFETLLAVHVFLRFVVLVLHRVVGELGRQALGDTSVLLLLLKAHELEHLQDADSGAKGENDKDALKSRLVADRGPLCLEKIWRDDVANGGSSVEGGVVSC